MSKPSQILNNESNRRFFYFATSKITNNWIRNTDNLYTDMLRSFNNSVILRLIASDDVIYNNAPWMEFRFSNTSLCIDVNSLFNLIVLLFFTLGLHSCLCGQFVQSCIHFFGPSVLITFHMLRHFKYKFFFVWTYYIFLFIFFWN